MLQAGQQVSLRSGRGQKSICLTISANSSSTMVLLLADVSMKGQPQSSASAWPSLGDTSLSSSRSTLLPTSTTGTCWYLGKWERENKVRGVYFWNATPSSPCWVCFATKRDYRNFLVPKGESGRESERDWTEWHCVCVCVCALLAYILYLLDETIRFFFFLNNAQWSERRGINTFSPSFPGGPPSLHGRLISAGGPIRKLSSGKKKLPLLNAAMFLFIPGYIIRVLAQHANCTFNGLRFLFKIISSAPPHQLHHALSTS